MFDRAEVVELADALDSGSSGRKAVGVQVPLPAPVFRGFSHILIQIFLFNIKKCPDRSQVVFPRHENLFGTPHKENPTGF